jgi:hypothetical protein
MITDALVKGKNKLSRFMDITEVTDLFYFQEDHIEDTIWVEMEITLIQIDKDIFFKNNLIHRTFKRSKETNLGIGATMTN